GIFLVVLLALAVPVAGYLTRVMDGSSRVLRVFGPLERALFRIAALEAGADDVNTNEDGSIEVLCDWQEFSKVKDALEAAGFKAELAEVTMKPQNEVEFSGDDAVKMQKLLDVLEDLDDVQEVYTNALIVDE
ncbi:YebC/PmpR family DNA-binding transcriptional regulator, partial [Burkholderia gladioli]|nr:YebC/PmpR family DNA-binding transcriptional regulator [Burkholderia gladioli]